MAIDGIATDALLPLLSEFLPCQRWYRGVDAPAALNLLHSNIERAGWPALVDLIVDADGEVYQVLVGLRPSDERPEFLRGHDEASLGEIDTSSGAAHAYEATLDPELGSTLLDRLTSGSEHAERVRTIAAEQSNTSLVYDDRLILKLFRRLHAGVNPEIEVTEALARVGFQHIAAPVASSQWGDYSLGVLQPYLAGGVEGWALALTSLRDLFGVQDTQPVPLVTEDGPPPAADPGQAGGDFSAEAERLGAMTAQLHIALAEAFGTEPGDSGAWADQVAAQVSAAPIPDNIERDAIDRVVNEMRNVSDSGPATRVHGDYHLGQVMRTDEGWYILDFEGEPDRSVDDRRRTTSPLRDVAGMLRSFHYASLVALADSDEIGLVAAWEERNRRAFLDGYIPAAENAGMLSGDGASVERLLRGFELEKAAYELNYEEGHRPDWARIPKAALRRLTR
ncbi:MAG TPA: phosphotransferase [Acidimicrobiales bacterium]|nr:phosphotransferase [Acidimicrobiales bacterium]